MENLSRSLKICIIVSSIISIYYPLKIHNSTKPGCLIAVLLFSQIDEQYELKAIEKEKAVVALPPKEASKCHREDLAKAFYVRTGFACDAMYGRVF